MVSVRQFITGGALALAALLALSPLFAGQSARDALRVAPAPAYVPGEVLVRFTDEMGAGAQASVLASFGDAPMRARMGSGNVARVKLGPGRAMAAALAAYRAMPGVVSVQPNYIYRFMAVPNDPSYDQQWGLNNTGQAVTGAAATTSRVAGADMSLEQAWDEITDCSSVIVAVADSGINHTQEDLVANMWDGSGAGFPNHGFDFHDDDNDPMASDAVGHGSHVAGTIGAVGNNGTGVTGVCWRAALMALRVGDVDGASTANLILAIDFAVTNGARIINMSLAGPSRDPLLEAEIASARDNGVIIVAAAGNSATNNDIAPAFPCSYPQDNVICVAALDQAYNLASFSNFGADSVDVGAPGVNVLSTWPGRTISDNLTGWTRNGGWSELNCAFNVGTLPTLANPATWCSLTGQYAHNADEVAYKAFDLSGTLHASASFLRFLDTESGVDFLGFAKRGAGGDPFSGGTLIAERSGSTNGFAAEEYLDLAGCLTNPCTFGFRLRSNVSVADLGAGIVQFEINTTEQDSDAYQVLNGTSMATPHTAGVAAMVWAHNSDYTYRDVVQAVTRGGESVSALTGVTSTGRAVNAFGSLQYINPPTGVAATVIGPS